MPNPTTKPLVAYHGDPGLKARILEKIALHRAADEIAQGKYYARVGGKLQMCAVGCVLEDPSGGHARYETEFGIPAQLAYLEDGIFESLPVEVAREWPARFMGAIEPGADLSKVWPHMAMWLMTDPEWGLVHVTEAEDVKAVCVRVSGAYARIAAGEEIDAVEQQAITDAAWDARAARDAWAAWAARDAWDAWAARDAWDAWAAWAAWDARDARDARDAFSIASADKLIELLSQAEATGV